MRRDEQERFYLELHERHGDDPRALSYRDRPTQEERFVRLARAFPTGDATFTVHEIGCGLGDLGVWLETRCPGALYSGSDVVGRFVERCRERFPGGSFHLRDVAEDPPDERYDWVVLSGLFNVRLSQSRPAWQAFVWRMLDVMYGMARRGVACNFLTTYVDAGRERDDLYYQDPRQVFDYATRHLSRHVEIDASGPLYDYTVRIHRPGHVRTGHPDPAFDRYFDDPAR